MKNVIEVENLYYSIDDTNILRDISLQVKEKKFVGIIGANGCGKSTLLKNIYRFLKPKKGKIKVNSIFIEDYSSKEIAKKISVLAQKQSMNFDFTIEEIVEMGRYAHQNSIFKNEINNDIVKDSLQAVGMYDMRKRSFLTLSGGEMQRIFIARTLAQNTDILILDEPTNHLDIKYQLQIMDLVKRTNKTILAVIHDMNIASAYCDYIYALKKGEIVAYGDSETFFTKENIKKVFDINCEVISHPKTKRAVIIF